VPELGSLLGEGVPGVVDAEVAALLVATTEPLGSRRAVPW
jgi:hypothetical protein